MGFAPGGPGSGPSSTTSLLWASVSLSGKFEDDSKSSSACCKAVRRVQGGDLEMPPEVITENSSYQRGTKDSVAPLSIPQGSSCKVFLKHINCVKIYVLET